MTRGWRDGWFADAERIESPNFGARPDGNDVTLVVLHSISLPPGEYGGDAVERLFTNRLDWDAHPYFQSIRGATVSSHFFIRRNAALLQFVSCDARAWHAGASSWRGRGGCNDFSVGIELEGLEGASFELVQYRRLTSLLRALRSAYRALDAVVGHEHVAPGRKHDPGSGFDWTLLRRRLRWPTIAFPPEL